MNPLPATRLSVRRALYQCLRTRKAPLSMSARVHSDPENLAARPKKRYNPYDEIHNQAASAEEMAKLKKDFRKTAFKLGLTIAAGLIAYSFLPSLDELERRGKARERAKEQGTHQADAKPEDQELFQGRRVVVAAGGSKLVAEHPTTHEQLELVETGTSYVPHFPKTIKIPSAGGNDQDSEYTLLGLGIRRVSFLSVQVYIVGFYVKTTQLAALQASLVRHINPLASALIPGEKEQLKKALLDPEESQKIWEAVLLNKDSRIDSAFRVVPVRDTNFSHLRDGWVTGINNRIQDTVKKQQQAPKDVGAGAPAAAPAISNVDDETMGQAMRSFKQLFSGRGKAAKGSIIILSRDGNGHLDAYFQKAPETPSMEKIGSLDDERIGQLIWQLYLGGKNVSSEEARANVAQGVLSIVERPVGTVETQVL